MTIHTEQIQLIYKITTQITHSSTCDLSEFEYFTAYFQNGRKCFGQVYQNNVNAIFQPVLKDCSVHTFSNEYRCIEYSTFVPTNDKLLITVTISAPYHVHCWLFPFGPGRHNIRCGIRQLQLHDVRQNSGWNVNSDCETNERPCYH